MRAVGRQGLGGSGGPVAPDNGCLRTIYVSLAGGHALSDAVLEAGDCVSSEGICQHPKHHIGLPCHVGRGGSPGGPGLQQWLAALR